MTRRHATILSIITLAVLGVTGPADATHHPHDVSQTPKTLSLGKVPLNTTAVLEFTVTNKGTEPLVNTGFSLAYSGDAGFAFGSVQLHPGTCVIGGVLAPGESCTYAYSGTTEGSGRVRDGEVCYLVGHVDVSENVCSKFSLVVGKQ
jgi:hypothetical protein